MQFVGGRSVFSASDLNDYLECRRLTELEALVARGALSPPANDDERAALIRKKGEEHEKRHLERLRVLHGNENVVEFERSENTLEAFHAAERQTLAAMRAGTPIIYQATFFDGQFLGRADFLHRVEEKSNLGDWSYEVLDTKLALKPKPYFLVQLCNYAEHLNRLQGQSPAHGSIVLGDGSAERYLLHDYLAYYRRLKSRFLAFAETALRAGDLATAEYPHPCSHCDICAWNEACAEKRRRDDHLSLVARMRRDQIVRFEATGIASVRALASAGDGRPEGMSPETFAKLRRQAEMQVRGRDGRSPQYDLLDHAPPFGFAQLPEPATGDVFFDMEGDPLYEPGRGLEYLFGCWLPDDDAKFLSFWGCDRQAERHAFERFVDFVALRRRRYPAMHVYHYGTYEKSALRTLAQAHCTREQEVDELLRGEVLVDLFAIVRQSIVISEEHYGLKDMEKFYGQPRRTEVKKGDQSIVMFERWLESHDDAILDDIAVYNRDDCESTYRLREWLLQRRVEAITRGMELPFRRVKSPGEPCHREFTDGCTTCTKRRQDEREEARRTELERELLRGVLSPQSEDEYRAMHERQRASYLLANLLAYHRREEKPGWWKFFDRCENVDELQEFDREAIGGLKFDERVEPVKRDRSFVFTFTFPEQHHKLGKDDVVSDPLTQKSGTIVEINEDARENALQLKWASGAETARAITALIPHGPLDTRTQRSALRRIAESFVAGRLETENRATFDLLTASDPRIRAARPDVPIQPELVTGAAVSSIIASLDRSYLFVQGPPGSGKTTTGARVICDLLARGKRIGITSTGHKAMHNLLAKVEHEMAERGARFRGRYKYSPNNAGSSYDSPFGDAYVTNCKDNLDFENGDYDLAAGTSWLFAREGLARAFDYLFIDEAGQVSLADALAVSGSATNVVLLGDPAQLAQVSQGIHPLHAGDSVLQHLLGDKQTVPKHRGVFLDVSYRLQPRICAYVSEAAYDGRLTADPATRTHAVIAGGASRCGLEFMAIEHAGNSSSSAEEADAVVREIALLLEGEVVDSRPPEPGRPRRLEQRDVIVVTPYNAQRRLITRALHHLELSDVEVGTVDKFQGREAAVVFYSMATSSGEDVPRDMEFLFERNRFNVAVSRARALSILVCSPRLLDVACRTPEQMALANLLCAFVEQASESPEPNPGRIRTLDGVTP